MISYADMAQHHIFAVLGELFSDALSARSLLEDFGADQAHLPPFGAPLVPELYWRQVCREISRGRFAQNLDVLVDCALRQYPYNGPLGHFRDLLRQGTVSFQSAAGQRILLLLSEPTDLGRARLTQEFQLIQEIVAAATIRVSLTVNAAVRLTDLLPAVLDVRPHVVHFAGHGALSGEVAAQDGSGQAASVHVAAIARLLYDIPSVHTLLLGACNVGNLASQAPRRFAVIGCERSLPGGAALAFSRGFYAALVRGMDTEEGFKYGCDQVELEGHDRSVFRLWSAPSSGDGDGEGKA